jgi:hypothetical protein
VAASARRAGETRDTTIDPALAAMHI